MAALAYRRLMAELWRAAKFPAIIILVPKKFGLIWILESFFEFPNLRPCTTVNRRVFRISKL